MTDIFKDPNADIFEGLSPDGWKAGWEPGREIFTGYEGEVEKIEQKYVSGGGAADNKAAGTARPVTVFYGASNFRMWKNMDKDLAVYGVQNHGFGGATDVLLMHYAPRILFPCKPDVVVVQSGSNDYMGMTGSLNKKAATSLALKRRMYEYFRSQLPQTRFVVLGALLMPGFVQATELSLRINEGLKALCAEVNDECSAGGYADAEYKGAPLMTYVDLAPLTYCALEEGGNAAGTYRTELFKSDGIHLNRDGQLALCEGFIKPALAAVFGK